MLPPPPPLPVPFLRLPPPLLLLPFFDFLLDLPRSAWSIQAGSQAARQPGEFKSSEQVNANQQRWRRWRWRQR